QWTVPEQPQLISFTGFIGRSFLRMLTNAALTRIIEQLRSPSRALILPIAVLLLPIVNGIYGNVVLKNSVAMLASDSITIGATVDLINQDPEVIALGDQLTAGDGYLADTPEMQQAIFDINRQLSVELTTAKQPQYIVWGENEYMNADDAHMVNQLAALSQELSAYITVDTVWNTVDAMYDTAFLVGPNGEEVGRTPKIFTLWGEEQYGFSPGPKDYNVYETAYAKTALAVCWDRHDPSILRGYARNGAQLVLIPADDDFYGNAQFPYFSASDAVFRAVENRLAIGSGSTSGIAQVITPYGEMTAMSGVNEWKFIVGDTFVTE